jgi:hypothetical protein
LSQIIFIRRLQYPPNHFLSIAKSHSTEGLCTTLSSMIFTGDREINATSTAYIGGRFVIAMHVDTAAGNSASPHLAAFSGLFGV